MNAMRWDAEYDADGDRNRRYQSDEPMLEMLEEVKGCDGVMDVLDYLEAVKNVYDMLKSGGIFVVVISHPAFACGPGGWNIPAMESPRREERGSFRVDNYFIRGAFLGAWADFDPVHSFHRPLRDYWQTFTEAGFSLTRFEEPSITERSRRELSAGQVHQAMRIPFLCILDMSANNECYLLDSFPAMLRCTFHV